MQRSYLRPQGAPPYIYIHVGLGCGQSLLQRLKGGPITPLRFHSLFPIPLLPSMLLPSYVGKAHHGPWQQHARALARPCHASRHAAHLYSKKRFLIVDTEFHRHDDTAPEQRWKARATYDLAIVTVEWDGTVVESRRWIERLGALSGAQLAEARGYLAARPSQLVCCWGSAEFDLFRSAGRKAADGTDGFDVRECILQVLPRMRNLTSADDTRRFSLSMNLLTPLFGLRAAPFHTALCDCEGEAVIITAFIRHLCRSQRMPPPPPSATSAKHLPPPAWDEDDDDDFE